MTLRTFLEQKGAELPGGNLAKTILYTIFPICVLLLITDNPLFCANIHELVPHQRASFLILLASIGAAVLSGWCVQHIMSEDISEIKRYSSLFYGKILIGVSVLLFYGVVCWWILLIGGITLSPFAALLSMSPILLLIHAFRDRIRLYDSFRDKIRTDWESLHGDQSIRAHGVVKWVLVVLSTCPLVLVLATLILGQWAVCKLSVHETLLGGAVVQVTGSEWYVTVYHVIYYLSVLIAVFGVMPPEALQRITRALF